MIFSVLIYDKKIARKCFQHTLWQKYQVVFRTFRMLNIFAFMLRKSTWHLLSSFNLLQYHFSFYASSLDSWIVCLECNLDNEVISFKINSPLYEDGWNEIDAIFHPHDRFVISWWVNFFIIVICKNLRKV